MSDAKVVEKKPSIYEAIPLITGAVAPIAKDRKGDGVQYKFRGIEDVYAVLNLLLARYGVSILPEVLDSKHEIAGTTKGGSNMYRHMSRVRFHLVDSYGVQVTADAEGEGMDTSDKSSAKAASTAYKAMAFQVFCIPTGEKIDSEEESPEVEAKPAAKANGHHAQAAAPAHADPSVKLCMEIKERIIKCPSVAEMVKLDTEIAEAHKKHSINDAQKARLGEIVSARLKDVRTLQENAA